MPSSAPCTVTGTEAAVWWSRDLGSSDCCLPSMAQGMQLLHPTPGTGRHRTHMFSFLLLLPRMEEKCGRSGAQQEGEGLKGEAEASCLPQEMTAEGARGAGSRSRANSWGINGRKEFSNEACCLGEAGRSV